MTYYGAKELAASFRTVRKNTISIAEDIPESKYDFKAAPDARSVAQMLAHITRGFNFQHQIHVVEHRTTLEGVDFPGLMQKFAAEEQKPRSKAEIIAMLREGGEKWSAWVEGLSEGFLGEMVGMPPGMTPASKSRFEMILGAKEHEMHHRAQLMLIERMIGIVPHLTREFQERMTTTAKA